MIEKLKKAGLDHDFLTTTEAVEAIKLLHGISVTRFHLSYKCITNKIKGAVKRNNIWYMPRSEVLNYKMGKVGNPAFKKKKK